MAALAGGSAPAQPTDVLQAIDDLLGSARQPPSVAEGSEVPCGAPQSSAAADQPPAQAQGDIQKPRVNERVLAAFQVEHSEHLEGIRAILANLEEGGGEVSDAQWDEVYRRAHSVKGGARAAGLSPVEQLGHRLETLFSRIRDGAVGLDEHCPRVAHQALDAIEDSMAAVSAGQPMPDFEAVLSAIDGVLTGAPPAPPVALEAPSRPTPAEADGAPALRVDSLRLSAENLDRLLRSAGEVMTESLGQDVVEQELRGVVAQIAEIEKDCVQARPLLRRLDDTPECSLAAQHLESVARQVHSLSERVRGLRATHRRSAWSLGLHAKVLQEDVHRVRMVPAGTMFQGFRKMVRDLARDEGKEVNLRVTGFETEADRMVLQSLKDPLMHMLRNAVSHGIEPPQEREQQGKGRAGQITLKIETQGNRLSLWVGDDGRGIDFERVGEVAVKRGLLPESELGGASPTDLVPLLFESQFSTSQVVTEGAGRGMGRSVVYDTVTRRQGRTQLLERDGGGVWVHVTVPLSVATYRLIFVSCRGETFAIPFYGVEALHRVPVESVETVEGKPVGVLDGQPVPLQSLGHLLSLDDAAINVSEGVVPVAVLRSGGRRLAVAVDGFLSQRDAILRDLPAPASKVAKLAGAILLEDGSVCLVVSPAALIEGFEPSERLPMLEAEDCAPGEGPPTILVVDDSITTRTLERSLLEAHGYNVLVAVDGIEGLSRLRSEDVDLAIVDVQMPRMDGFTMLGEMKNDPRLAKTPVIMVTSMDSREDQERGLALGADAYIVKQKFDHQGLLETIEQMV